MDCAQRARELEQRLEELEQNLLPPRPFKTTGTYTEQELDGTRAYRLLAHAEVEACLEDMARGVAVDVHAAWVGDRRPRVPVVTLLAYSPHRHGSPPEALPLAGPADVAQRVAKAKDSFARAVNANNGLREDNVLALLMPVGITEYDINQTWLATIDSFGQWRGDTAHSSAKKARYLPDPATELSTVQNILQGVKDVAAQLDALQS